RSRPLSKLPTLAARKPLTCSRPSTKTIPVPCWRSPATNPNSKPRSSSSKNTSFCNRKAGRKSPPIFIPHRTRNSADINAVKRDKNDKKSHENYRKTKYFYRKSHYFYRKNQYFYKKTQYFYRK